MISRVVLPFPDDAVLEAITRVAESGQYVKGPEIAAFERAWAEYCGAGYCVGVGSGGQALLVALLALDIQPGDRVLLPALSYVGSVRSVVLAGGVPVYCDVDASGLMDVVSATRISPCRFIMPVHLYGQVVEMSWVRDLADSMGAFVVEDAAQAHSSLISVQGDFACFSFYPTKNLGALGEAGALVTDDESLYHRAYDIVRYGDRGLNFVMDEIQAAVLNAKLPGLDSENERRERVAEWYRELGISSFARGNNHLYPVTVSDPGRVKARMFERGVEVGQHYPYILSDIVPSPDLGIVSQAQQIAYHHVTLPMYPELDREAVKCVSEELIRACS